LPTTGHRPAQGGPHHDSIPPRPRLPARPGPGLHRADRPSLPGPARRRHPHPRPPHRRQPRADRAPSPPAIGLPTNGSSPRPGGPRSASPAPSPDSGSDAPSPTGRSCWSATTPRGPPRSARRWQRPPPRPRPIHAYLHRLEIRTPRGRPGRAGSLPRYFPPLGLARPEGAGPPQTGPGRRADAEAAPPGRGRVRGRATEGRNALPSRAGVPVGARSGSGPLGLRP
jgi:hypothetical protein